ncbi:MAG: DUF4394 domain-containing protein [Pseudomonadota bacterium]
MIRTITTASVLALTTGAASAGGHSGLMGYALADNGQTLVVMPSLSDPATVETVDLSVPMRAIAYRPVTGELVGFSGGSVFNIDPMTGTLNDLGATFMEDAAIDADAAVAFDFNNAIDAVRAVGSDGTNLVYFPEGFGDMDDRAGSVRKFTDTFYGFDDPNFGEVPEVFANAYTNAVSGMTATTTKQYVLDSQTNALVSLANNAGELSSVGYLEMNGEAVDILPVGGFDIVSPEEGTDLAYAILQKDGAATAGLYAIDLESAVLTQLADLGRDDFTGFAVSMGAM